MHQEYTNGKFVISTDPEKLDLGVIHGYLANESYWAEKIPPEVVAQAIEHSLNFGLYVNTGEQIGYARVITDFTTFAYLCDVFVLPKYRGKGLAKWLMASVMAQPDLQNLRRFMLMTKDAHRLYTRYGFAPVKDPANCLEIARPGLYKNSAGSEQ